MMIDKSALGRIAKLKRRRMGLSQNDIAMKTHTTLCTVSHFETGHTCPSKLLMWYIAHDIITIDDIKECYNK